MRRQCALQRRRRGARWQDRRVGAEGDTADGSGDEYSFPSWPAAQLLVGSDGSAHVLYGSAHYRRDPSGWRLVESLPIDADVAAFGPGGTLHAVETSPNSDGTGQATYATNRDGTWRSEVFDSQLSDQYFAFHYDPGQRYVSLAVDSSNAAHVTYTRAFANVCTPDQKCSQASELRYATNRSGTWMSEVVASPSDGSADAGLGASVAIDRNDEVAIAGLYVERAVTGSAQSSQLRFYRRQSSGNWTYEVIANHADGYAGKSGSQFTGFAPYLLFDSYNRPHVLFSDHAAGHYDFGAGSFDEEFASRIRYGYRDDHGWHLQTLFPQHDPLRQQLLFPALALSPQQIAFAGLAREEALGSQDYEIVDTAVTVVDGMIACPGGACGPTYTPSAISSATPTPTATTTSTSSPTRTATRTPTSTPTRTPTLTPTPGLCVADCDHSGKVTANELVRAVNITLGKTSVSDCPTADANFDTKVTVDELVRAVEAALVGCRGQVAADNRSR